MPEPVLNSPIGVALIGAGMIAPSHVRALCGLGDRLRLRWVVSRRPERAEYLAGDYTGPRPNFTADLDKVTGDPSVHMAIVATPPNARIDLISKLARAGKHILLEKPVARTLAEAEQVVEICETAGVTLGLLFQHRVRAPSVEAKRLAATGALGALGMVEIAAPLWRDQSYYDELGRGTYARDGGGVLLTQAIHTIDLALSFTGPLTEVQAMMATSPLHQMEAEDFAVAGLRFANGAVGSLVASTASFPASPETVTLHYEHASLCIGRKTLWINWRDGRREVFPPDPDDPAVTPPDAAKHLWHQAVIADFAVALQEGRPPLVTGREALAAHRLITAMETSSSSGKQVSLA